MTLMLFFWVSFALLVYSYGGYLLLLLLLPNRHGHRNHLTDPIRNCTASVTVVVTCKNEEEQITARIENLLQSDYPGRLEILIVSDGSADETATRVASFTDTRIRLLEVAGGRGKSAAQNNALAEVMTEIVVFTDADTRFDPSCLRYLTSPFADPKVGGVDGDLRFYSSNDGVISTSQGLYWKYEQAVRQLESNHGLLAVMSGPCMAVRKSALYPIDEDVGEDCVVPLDLILRGYKVVKEPRAVAWDRMRTDIRGEYRARVRMTLRNWLGTWRRSVLLNPLKHPGYALSLWSHKLLRWISPLFLFGATAAAYSLADDSRLYQAILLGFSVFYSLGFVGAIGAILRRRIPLASSVFSFLLANIGFLVGVLRALSGTKIVAYK
jgi:cellulose synthase/poly-beta-1,6-N-acetylglucosamine synthase-like glycosyltransferase